MGKEAKITIKYEGLSESNIADLLTSADEGDLRVMLALSFLDKTKGGATQTELCKLLGMDKGELAGSLKFWRGAALIANAPKGGEKEPKAVAPTPAPAHREGALEYSASFGGYSSGELADIMDKRKELSYFIDEAQRIVGKIFRNYDTSILIHIVEDLGFEEEAVLMMLKYMVSKGKKTTKYAETLAMSLYDMGITETAEVMARLERMERAGEIITGIKVLYGIGDRALTSTEKKLFTTWTETYGYDIDVIRMAYDITVDNTQKPIPKYTNAILERWYAERLRTVEDVRAYLEAQKASSGEPAKSYDADEFFEAALKRSQELFETVGTNKDPK